MLTTGEPPVSGSTSHDIMNNIKAGHFNFKVMQKKALSSTLVDLINKILIK